MAINHHHVVTSSVTWHRGNAVCPQSTVDSTPGRGQITLIVSDQVFARRPVHFQLILAEPRQKSDHYQLRAQNKFAHQTNLAEICSIINTNRQ
jgi:hypothetical protein